MGMQMLEALIGAGLRVGELPALYTSGKGRSKYGQNVGRSCARCTPSSKCNKLHKMADMQEKYQGCRTISASTFDEVGKGRSAKVKRKIADVWALGEDGYIHEFKKDQHIYMPANSRRWFLTKGVPLAEYEDGTLVLEGV